MSSQLRALLEAMGASMPAIQEAISEAKSRILNPLTLKSPFTWEEPEELYEIFPRSPEHLEDVWGTGQRVGTRKVHAIKVLCEAVKAKGASKSPLRSVSLGRTVYLTSNT